MIQKFNDHAANERTFLAWIRTAITIMAFGFLVEKFELYISSLNNGGSFASKKTTVFSAEIVGLSLVLVGVLVILAATIRFYTFKRSIEADQPLPFSRTDTNLVLSILLILLGLFLIVFMGHQVLG
jgi:putative membrane protein